MSGLVTAHDLMRGEVENLTGRIVVDGFISTIDFPADGKVIAVGWRRNVPTLWVLGPVDGDTESARFVVIADGVHAPDGVHLHEADYVGSALPGPGGDHAFHVFRDRGI